MSEQTKQFIQRTIEVYKLSQPETMSEELALKCIDHAVCWMYYLEDELGTDDEDVLMQDNQYRGLCEIIEELDVYVA